MKANEISADFDLDCRDFSRLANFLDDVGVEYRDSHVRPAMFEDVFRQVDGLFGR